MLKNILISFSVILIFSGCFYNNYTVFYDNETAKYGVREKDSIVLKPFSNYVSKINTLKDKDYFVYEKENKYGIIDINGNILLPTIFDEINRFYNQIAVVKEKDKFGFINKNLQLIQKPIFLEVRDFIFDVSFVKSPVNNKFACIDKNMNFLSDFIYEKVFIYDGDYARIIKDDKWGLIDKKCKEVVNSEYDYISESINDVLSFIKNNRIVFKNKSEF